MKQLTAAWRWYFLALAMLVALAVPAITNVGSAFAP